MQIRPLWVKLGSPGAPLGSPLYPQEQTSPAGPVWSEKCHQPKSALVTLRSASPSNSDIARCCRRSTSSAARS